MQLKNFLPLLFSATLARDLPQAAKRGCGGPPPPSSASATSVSPYPTTTSGSSGNASAVALAKVIQQISPDTGSCAPNGQYTSQCATATEAAGPILDSFTSYNISTVNEKAAMISLMMYECVDFKYDVNVYPGRPGQGTRNMMEAPFILKYAQSIPALSSKLSAIIGTETDTTKMSNQTLNSMRDLVTSNPDYDFGSASWFLRSQCSPAVQSALKTGKQAEWANYLSSCVGVQASEGNRTAYYTAAVAALGGS